MLDEIGTYTESVSSFGGSAILSLIVLVLSWAFSAIHVFEEWRGSDFPLWRAFGAIEGVYLPNWLGFPFFTVLLLLILWITGLGGIVGWGVVGWIGFQPNLGGETVQQGVFWLGFLIGSLVSDCIFFHWIPYLARYRPNPGVRSTALYALEAALLVALFWKGLSTYPAPAVAGILVGALFFLAVWGVLVAVRMCVPPWRQPPWVSGQPIPSWARS
jgi:hypothetical protein